MGNSSKMTNSKTDFGEAATNMNSRVTVNAKNLNLISFWERTSQRLFLGKNCARNALQDLKIDNNRYNLKDLFINSMYQ